MERFLNLMRARIGSFQFWLNSTEIEMLISIWKALQIADLQFLMNELTQSVLILLCQPLCSCLDSEYVIYALYNKMLRCVEFFLENCCHLSRFFFLLHMQSLNLWYNDRIWEVCLEYNFISQFIPPKWRNKFLCQISHCYVQRISKTYLFSRHEPV